MMRLTANANRSCTYMYDVIILYTNTTAKHVWVAAKLAVTRWSRSMLLTVHQHKTSRHQVNSAWPSLCGTS